MKKIIFTSIFWLLVSLLFAQTKNETELRVTLRDGSSFAGKTAMGNVTLITNYGKLEIPLQNVSSLDLGITPDKSNETRIINLIKQLGNSDENMRKSAYDELVKMEIRAIPVMSNFIYSEKYQPTEFTDYTPESALSELKSTHNIDDNFSDKDVITIDYQYTMGGVYDFKKLDLKTEYGLLSLPKEKIKHIDVLYVPSSGENSDKTFILLASKHISGNNNGGWLKTGIMLKQGQKFSITASGEITLASLSNNKYHPDGSTGTSTSTTTDTYEGDYNYGSTSAYPTYGNVVYKIGESGTMLKAGAKFNGSASAGGLLYLSMYETVYNASNTGSYTVKVLLK